MEHLMVVLVLLAFAFTDVAVAQDNPRPRVYIEESESWEIESDPVFSSTDKKGRVTISGGETKGGAKPRTAHSGPHEGVRAASG